VKQCGRFHLPSNGNDFRVRVRVPREAGLLLSCLKVENVITVLTRKVVPRLVFLVQVHHLSGITRRGISLSDTCMFEDGGVSDTGKSSLPLAVSLIHDSTPCLISAFRRAVP
jgi:hypothetical protein